MNSNNRRGQSGVDMVMTYGWIFIVGIGAVIILSQMGTFTHVPCEKTKYGFSQLMPTDWGVYIDSNVIVSKVENWAGGQVDLIGMNVALDDVSCDSTGIVSMGPGRGEVITMTCGDSPKLSDKYVKGSCYVADVTISYRDIASGALYTSKGTLRGPVEEGNAATAAPQFADLTITDIYVDVGAGVKARPTSPGVNPSGPIRYVIGNPGDTTAGLSHSSISLAGAAPVIIGPAVGSISTGSSSDEGTGVPFPSPCPNPGGTFKVTICADANNDVTEKDETIPSNCMTVDWYCAALAGTPVVELITPCDCCIYGTANKVCDPLVGCCGAGYVPACPCS